MAQKSEYKVIHTGSSAKLHQELVKAGMEGWKPILMSTAAAEKMLHFTVILEHVLGT